MENMTLKSESTVGEREMFTKGPWQYGRANNYTGFYIAPLNRLPTLAAVQEREGGLQVSAFNFPGHTEANARLIAAAPELYEALKLAEYALGNAVKATTTSSFADMQNWAESLFLPEARAALAKATRTEAPSYGLESEVHSDGGQS